MPRIELPNKLGTTEAACLSAAVYAWSRIGGPLPGNPRGVLQGSEQWRKLREGKITASVAGMALNISPFGNRVRGHEILRGEAEVEVTEAMQRGTRLESLARLAYQRAVGQAVSECGIYVSKQTPFLAASPDGVVLDNDGYSKGFVELKVPSSGVPAGISDAYLLQCVLHCYCGELPRCDFVSFGTHGKLSIQRVTYDSEAFTEDILPMLQSFYALMDEANVSNLLPGRDAAFLRQVIKDYRDRHLSQPRIVTHGLKVEI